MKFRIHWLAFPLAGIFSATSVYAEKDGICLETLTEGNEGVCTPVGVPPMIDGFSFMSEPLVKDQANKDVLGCCSETDNDSWSQSLIGKMPQFSTERSLEVLQTAKKAWNYGRGEWPQMSLKQRIQKVEEFLDALKEQRDAIINCLMWEIGKNYKDAASEFDRTIEFSKKVSYL